MILLGCVGALWVPWHVLPRAVRCRVPAAESSSPNHDRGCHMPLLKAASVMQVDRWVTASCC